MLALLLAVQVATVELLPQSALTPEVAADLAERAEAVPEALRGCGLHLGLGEPLALDERGERLLLAGGFGAAPMGPFRSVALLSEDGGRTWREVMTPAGGHEVSQLARAGPDVWALVALVVEGPGPVDLVHSSDGGRTWRLMTSVSKRQPLGVVGELSFADARHGRLVVDYEGYDDGPPRELQVTEDGGRTWRVAGPAPAPAASGTSAWRLTAESDSPDAALVLEHRSAEGADWEPRRLLPVRWRRDPDGSLRPCGTDQAAP